MASQSNSTDILGFIVRLMGLVMLVIGLAVAIKVIVEAWDLYQEPQNIERFADAIEQGSGLDSLLNNFTTKPSSTELTETETETATAGQPDSLRLTYFIAWIIAVLLLMVIGGLGMSAIKTGGQLALYDLQVKRFAREVLSEAKKHQD